MLFASFGQLESKSYYVNDKNIIVVGADGASYEVESKDLMKDHWNYSCFKTETIPIAPPARYNKSKNHQKIKIEANTTSDGSSTFFQLDGFEKQLEKREALLRQKENNIKKTIEVQIAEEHKHLKDEYDAFKSRLESEYNNCMVDMKQKTYSFKHQLESQHNSRSAELEKQYKSHISALNKANAIKDKEIGKLSSTISQLKNEKRDIKKTTKSVYKDLEDIIFTKDLKIIALNDRVIFSNSSAGRNGTIEPNTFISFHDAEYWTRKREDAKNSTLSGCRLIIDLILTRCRLIVDSTLPNVDLTLSCYRLIINPAFSFFMT
ncbi:unnamed protein product [Rhizophagus irregularis]|uniref:Uncharacterized protein n=1 Tax=Rhizophagus irregularis TaxID=588596 RepID=A0A915ZCP9_9GLOM|nr:unnamed protein product [Rhizophagus irregularis]